MPKEINLQLPEAGVQEIIEAIKRDKRPEVWQWVMRFCLLHVIKAPNGLRYLRWGGDGEAVQPEK